MAWNLFQSDRLLQIKKNNFESKNTVSRREGDLFWKICVNQDAHHLVPYQKEKVGRTHKGVVISQALPWAPWWLPRSGAGQAEQMHCAPAQEDTAIKPSPYSQTHCKSSENVQCLKMPVRMCWHHLEEELLGGPAETRQSGGWVALKEGPTGPDRDWGQEDTAALAAALSSARRSRSCLGRRCRPV